LKSLITIHGQLDQSMIVSIPAFLRLAVISLLIIPAAHGALQAAELRIAAGDRDGVYRGLAEAVCSAVVADQPASTCSVLETTGSVDNLNRLKDGQADFALVQADVLFFATNGVPTFGNGQSLPALQALASLDEETLTIVVRQDDGAPTLPELRGKRVGVASSGTLETFNLVINAFGWQPNEFSLSQDAPSALTRKLCDGQVDAAVFVVGHPNRFLQETAAACKVRIVPLSAAEINHLTLSLPFLVDAQVPTAVYHLEQPSGATVGVPVTLVTLPQTAASLVTVVANALYGNIGRLRASHPALAGITAERMGWASLLAPLHPAAAEVAHRGGN